MRFIDLFCGIGGFHQALTSKGHECVFASDIDKTVQKVYEANYGIHVHGDIRTVQAHTIPDFDILCAGFPCQPFSISGNKQGFIDKVRGTLFYEIVRIMQQHQPRYAILENVKNLLGHDNGETLRSILDTLDECGYKVDYKVMNAARFGLAQYRERVFFVCQRKDIAREYQFPNGSDDVCTVGAVLDPNNTFDMKSALEQRYDIVECESKVSSLLKPRMVAKLLLKSNNKGGRQGERVYSIDHPGITVCYGSGGPGPNTGLYDVHGKIRTLSAKETAQMFGFREAFDFCGLSEKKILNLFGNGVCVPVVRSIVDALLAD